MSNFLTSSFALTATAVSTFCGSAFVSSESHHSEELATYAKTQPVEESGIFDPFKSSKGCWAPTSAPKVKQPFLHGHNVSQFAVTSIVKKQSVSELSPVDNLAGQRIKLLAMKYAGTSSSKEVIARLEILNQKMSGLSPRISKAHIESLEQASANLAKVREDRVARMKSLGISI